MICDSGFWVKKIKMRPLNAFMRHIYKARVFLFRAHSFVKSTNECYKPFIKYSDYFHQFRHHRASYLGYSFYPLSFACGIGMLFVGAPSSDQGKDETYPLIVLYYWYYLLLLKKTISPFLFWDFAMFNWNKTRYLTYFG